ncbi:hypothetical protein HDU79_008944 [Rhizoclosmatium sp. JEL0117]|nr:hypothetical protein HDU79_008944 [Rhizoclosmatium sp. JEL0117]
MAMTSQPKFADASFPALSEAQLAGYLDRIGLSLDTGAPATLEVLNKVALHHSHSIPFENSQLTFCQKSGPTEVDAIYDTIVKAGRGGYCCQNNILLFSALKTLGFNVSCGVGRFAAWNETEKHHDLGPTQHMILFVELDSKTYLVDQGNNRFSMAIEIADKSTEPVAADELFQIRRSDWITPGNWMLWFKRAPWAAIPDGSDGDGFYPLFYFTLDRYRPADLSALNLFVSLWPEHNLRRRLIVSIVTKTYGRAVITDNVFRRREGSDHRHLEYVVTMTKVEELVDIMKKEFGVEMTQEEIDGANIKYFTNE